MRSPGVYRGFFGPSAKNHSVYKILTRQVSVREGDI